MKKNNKYRSNNSYNNNNNQIFSLNYKFDSISPAGKISGTALDLIKRYNELAKEAQGNADYVEAENFRQYAEHYRKIVTEINERKTQRFGGGKEEQPAQVAENSAETAGGNAAVNDKAAAEIVSEEKVSEDVPAADETASAAQLRSAVREKNSRPAVSEQAEISGSAENADPSAAAVAAETPRRSFMVIEINPADAEKPVSQARMRTRAPRKPKAEAAVL